MNALLPLMGDRLLLIGHDNGLSVLDMFPSGDPETSSPADAQVRHIWEGEGYVTTTFIYYTWQLHIDAAPLSKSLSAGIARVPGYRRSDAARGRPCSCRLGSRISD